MFSDDLNEIFELEASALAKRNDLINRIRKKLDSFRSKFRIINEIKIGLFEDDKGKFIKLSFFTGRGFSINNQFIEELTEIMETESYNQIFVDTDKLEIDFFYK
ncbi:MAG: hypothetical protein ABFD07_15785 [Methanobacterium sp.]